MPPVPALALQAIEKRFGGNVALAGVSLELLPAEVHALVGENGAGKSTLMKIVSGALKPDGGQMTLAGAAFAPKGPRDARRAGISMIYQELSLAPALTVEENILLGQEPSRLGVVSRSAQREAAVQALSALDATELDPGRRVSGLSAAERQLVEIARALCRDARVVVMDEPTSSLSGAETERLFGAVRRLRERGVAVVYISHFLDEVTALADRFTVLRDGRSVDTGTLPKTAPDDEALVRRLLESMSGRPLDETFPRVPHESGPIALELSGVSGVPLPRDASLVVRRGEILGIAGLVGAGRSELLRTLFGLMPMRAGKVTVHSRAGAAASDAGRSGASRSRPRPWTRLAEGIGLLSESRKEEGLAVSMSIEDNVTLSCLGRSSKLGWIRAGSRRAEVTSLAERLGIRYRAPEDAVASLSGGNQQKVALARLLHHDVDVLLLDEPTRGIDVGSKAQIYRIMGELAARGKAIVFVSSYLPELLGVCDRIAVMHRGRLGTPRRAAEWSQERLLAEATMGERG